MVAHFLGLFQTKLMDVTNCQFLNFVTLGYKDFFPNFQDIWEKINRNQMKMGNVKMTAEMSPPSLRLYHSILDHRCARVHTFIGKHQPVACMC
jgi:hypothetical protein